MKSAPVDRVLVVKAATPGPALSIVDDGGSARAVVWPGVGAEHRSMHLIELEAGGRTKELSHRGECVYHISEGGGTMDDMDSGESHEVIVGSMLFIEPETRYRFVAGAEGALILGGPCPPDPALYEGLDEGLSQRPDAGSDQEPAKREEKGGG